MVTRDSTRVASLPLSLRPQMIAGTLNCPSCGAGAPATAVECPFCHTKLATVGCPSCFGLVFAGAKFCDHCGAKVEVPAPREGVKRKCPRGCGDLERIALGDAKLDECAVCDGLWVDHPTFERLCADRERQAPVIAPHRPEGDGPKKVETVRYVPCPECRKLMNRENFAHSSGIVIDTCKQDGIWFDADELRRVIEFIRGGGIEAARKRDIETLVQARELKNARERGEQPAAQQDEHPGRNVDLLSVLLSTLLKPS
jgi:Zn-finger nucleic acid-binding protein